MLFGVVEASLRAEIAALHEQILAAYHSCGTEELFNLAGMLPDDIRPNGVPVFHSHPGPFKTKKRTADDML